MLIGGIMKRLKKRNRDGKKHQNDGSSSDNNDDVDSDDGLEDLAQTPFPNLNIESSSSSGQDVTDVSDVDSDDEEAIEARQKKYQSKVDEDVAVFLKLAEQMSLESLLHLLEGQARTQNLKYLQKYMKGTENSDDSDSDSESSDDDDDDDDDEEDEDEDEDFEKSASSLKTSSNYNARRSSAVSKTKQFRFAEVTNNQVRAVVHEVEPLTELKGELWWQEGEILEIRKNAIETVRFYARHRKDFIASVEQVFGAETQQAESPRHVKKLADEAFVRGLEGHIVSIFPTRRAEFRRAIVELQKDFQTPEQSQEQSQEQHTQDTNNMIEARTKALSEASVSQSQLTTKFALRMAQIDYLEALKSNMSRWRAEIPDADSGEGFFDC